MKIIEEADPVQWGGELKKKGKKIIQNFQDLGQTPARELWVSLPRLSSFALNLSAGGCWESGHARYRLGESGEGVQEGLALFNFIPISQDHADHTAATVVAFVNYHCYIWSCAGDTNRGSSVHVLAA